MKISFQDTNLELNEVNLNFDTMVELGEIPMSFGIMAFTTNITNCNFVEPTIMMGSTKLVKLALQGFLPENGVIFYDAEKFDQAYYHSILGDLLLNHEAQFVKWGDIKDQIISKPMFIKPSCDLKYFAGGVIEPSSRTVEGELSETRMFDADLTDDTSIMINYNSIPQLIREYRVFVVANTIIDISQYMAYGKVTPAEVNDYACLPIIRFVSLIQSIYIPHEHYVIDIAKDINGKLWIVEYNCINCSGMYKINRKLVFDELLAL